MPHIPVPVIMTLSVLCLVMAMITSYRAEHIARTTYRRWHVIALQDASGWFGFFAFLLFGVGCFVGWTHHGATL